MGHIKAETRAQTTHELGVRMEDLLEAGRAELERMRGARGALAEVVRKLEAHQAVVDRDRDQGQLDAEQHALVKRYVDQCGGIARNLVTAADVQLLVLQGKIAGLQQSVGEIKKAHDMADARLKACDGDELVEEDSADLPAARKAGQHPGDPLAARRDEAKKRRRSKNGKAEAADGKNA